MRNTLLNFKIALCSIWLLVAAISASAQSTVVDFVPVPVNSIVNDGATFSVTIEVQTNGQPTAGAEIHLDFDPTYLEVVSLSTGGTLPIPIQAATSNNTTGTIDYTAGTFSTPPTGIFDLLTIEFLAKAVVSSTSVTYSFTGSRVTKASTSGSSILDEAIPFTVTINDPCVLTSSGLSVSACDNGGTPSLPGDDTYSFTLNPVGAATGTTYTVSGDVNASGTYGTPLVISGQTAGAGDVSLTITDDNSAGCSLAVTVTDPGSCSEACTIATAGLANVQCNSNGTPSDPSDDFITFTLNPTGGNLSGSYSVTGSINLSGLSYGNSNFVTLPGTAGMGNLNLVLTDDADPSCSFPVTVLDPGSCSNNCVITASGLGNVLCNDNGTPTIPGDDYITFTLNPQGNGTNGTYTVSNVVGTTSGSFGGVTSFRTADGTAGAGDVSITLSDDGPSNCVLPETVLDPGTCSDECAITASGLSNISCNDNGTPSDPADDYITFDLNPVGNATAGTYTVSNVVGTTTGAFGSATSFRTADGTAGTGNVSITLSDDGPSNCTIPETVLDPGTCSDDCAITSSGLINVSCNDNGTSTIPGDDYITFELNPIGNAIGGTYTVSNVVGTTSGSYGSATTFRTADGTAGAGNLSITLSDDGSSNCVLSETVLDPGTCSDDCDLTASGLSNVSCNDNGTPTIPGDDYITFELNPVGNATAGTYTVSNVVGTTSGSYGSATTFRTADGTAGAGNVSITLSDAGTASCELSETLNDPGTCSDECAISTADLSNIQCNDNGTPENATDDYITFDLNPTGNATGTTYTVSNVVGATTGTYGSVTSFRTADGTAGAGDVSITLSDDDALSTCELVVIVTDPGICSSTLTLILGSESNFACDTILIPVTVEKYLDILGGQGTITWNDAVINFIETSQYGIPDLAAGSFNGVSPGQLIFTYNDASLGQLGHTLADGDTLFVIEFEVVGALGSSSPLDFSNSGIQLLFFDAGTNLLAPSYVSGLVEVPASSNLTGQAFSALNNPIPGVTFNLTGDDGPTSQTGAPGFDFPITPCADDELGAFKNNDQDADNGINTLDIIFMQRHILGISALATPYRLIAADVNTSGSINVLDILFVRQMVLQQRTKFPEPGGSTSLAAGNRLWAFVSSDFVFADPTSPWPFDTARVYPEVQPGINQDFIGMKLGDVNDSWNPGVLRTVAGDEVTFHLGEVAGQVGEEVSIPISVKDFDQLTGFQFTMNWDPSLMQLKDVVSADLEANAGMQVSEAGKLTVSWNDAAGQAITLADGSVVFELRMSLIGTSETEATLSISSDLTASEAYDEAYALVDIISAAGKVSISNATTAIDADLSDGYSLFQNVPNPFTQSTTLVFELPKREDVKILIFNSLGQEIRHFQGTYGAGEHELNWDGTSEGAMEVSDGVYYARMQAGTFSSTIRIQKQK